MKKGFFAAAIAAIVLLQGAALPTRSTVFPAAKAPADKVLLDYSWYSDPDFISFTGQVSTVNTELSRLRSLYSGYVFSATPGTGLTEFEWGYHPTAGTAKIWSNY